MALKRIKIVTEDVKDSKEILAGLGEFSELSFQQKLQHLRNKLLRLGRQASSTVTHGAHLKMRDLLLDLVWLFIDGLDTAAELNVLKNPARFRQFAVKKWQQIEQFLDELEAKQKQR